MEHYEITHLGQHGDGVAAGPVYAALTVPGDIVTGQREGDRLVDIRIARPSDLRVKPVCKHFKSCGGCNLQQVTEAEVADWKAGTIQTALTARGIDTEIRPTVTSPSGSRRRATFAARRTKSGTLAGFHARGSETVISTPDCQLVTPALASQLGGLETLAELGASRKHGLDILVTETMGGLDLAVEGGKPLDAQLTSDLARRAEDHGWTRLSWNGDVAVLRGPSIVRFDDISVPLPVGGFLQATVHGEAKLRDCVKRIVGHAPRISDLFAGCGTFALPLARQAEVSAYEGATSMTRALEEGWRTATGLKAVRAETRDLFRNPLLPEEMRKTDAIVIDPPRAGAAAQVAEIAKSSVELLAYVSCNPQTFARDAEILVGAGYKLEWVQPVDQFRWSPHVELVGAFRR